MIIFSSLFFKKFKKTKRKEGKKGKEGKEGKEVKEGKEGKEHWTKKWICSNLPMSKDVVNMIANLKQMW